MPEPTDDPNAGKPNNEPASGGGDGDGKPASGDAKPADGDAKPADGDGKPAAGDGKPADGDAKPEGSQAPEKYEGFKVPDTVELDAKMLTEFETTARTLGLSQENAQKLVDFGAALVEGGLEAQDVNRTETLETWEKEIKADEEYGGDKLGETLDRGRRVVRDHGSDGLKEVLESSGLGSNPHVLRFLVKLDKALGEDRTVDGKPVSDGKDAATVLYDGK